MLAEWTMNLGTLLLMLAAVPQIPAIWRCRGDLQGYSLVGSVVMFVGLSCICFSFFILKMWFSMLAQILPILMWGMVVWFKWRNNNG